MDSALIIFALSLLGIIAMIAHKMFELRTGKTVLFGELHKKVDEVATEWHGTMLEKIGFFTKENLKTLGRLAYVVGFRTVRAVKSRANALYAKFHNEMKQRAVLKNQGAPSFFLKNISEYKDKPVQ